MRRNIPEETALVMAAWWWPAIIGMLGIIAAGLVAWIGETRLTALVPGSRGARAVGTIFGITVLGAASHFVTPLLLLDEMAGFGNLVPSISSRFTSGAAKASNGVISIRKVSPPIMPVSKQNRWVTIVRLPRHT